MEQTRLDRLSSIPEAPEPSTSAKRPAYPPMAKKPKAKEASSVSMHPSEQGEDGASCLLRPGTLVVVAIDPSETLSPLFAIDPSLEKRARDLESRTRRYLAFARHVESEEDRKPMVQLQLVHTKRPSRSKYDSVDESMCVPILYGGQPGQKYLPRRGSAGDPREPMRLKSTSSDPSTSAEEHPPASQTPWLKLYAYTTMDITAAVSHTATPKEGFRISPVDMQRFDEYKASDVARERDLSRSDDYGDDDEDDDECRLSSVISGLSMTNLSMGLGLRSNPTEAGAAWEVPLGPISPTTLDTRDAFNQSPMISESTQPTTIPSYDGSRGGQELREQVATPAPLEPWMTGRLCTLHVRVWIDVKDGLLAHRRSAGITSLSDPRNLLEDLHAIQSLERASTLRATSQMRGSAAARIAAWRLGQHAYLSTASQRDFFQGSIAALGVAKNASCSHVDGAEQGAPHPNLYHKPNSGLKTIKRAWRRLTCREK